MEGNLRFKIDWAFLLCFTLYLRAISEYKPPGGLFWRGDLTEGFCVMSLGGLYLEGRFNGGFFAL